MACASTSCYSSSSTCHYGRRSYVVSTSRNPFSNLSYHHSTSKTRPGSLTRSAQNPKCSSSSSSQTFDVVVIGAGVIGLTVARQFLLGSDLSVAVVDKAVPCSGATGAGQGYLWMAHKTPGSDIWELAMRSHQLWRVFAESLRQQGLDPQHHLGWKNTGSLLIGRSSKEMDVLKRRVKTLSDAGVRSEYLSARDLISREPDLDVKEEEDCGAAFFPDDCQIDARCAADIVLEANRKFSAEGRYAEFFNDPVTSLLRSGGNGKVVGVKTTNNNLYSKVIVVAAGCWSGSLTQDLFRESEIVLDVPVRPRKGHLLVLKNFSDIQLNHALMEAGYVDHQTRTHLPNEASDHDQSLSISMTATIDSVGNLVLGSSRQFTGFGTEVEESVINRIWERAKDFFPKLREQNIADFINRREVRVGLRPYMPDGKPIIGAVPGLSNFFLATGHEGGGLSMALGTAEMVTDMVLGNPKKINHVPFSVQGRCC